MTYFEILTPEEVSMIHEASLSVLEETGLDLLHEPSRAYLSHAGAKVDGTRVFFSKGAG